MAMTAHRIIPEAVLRLQIEASDPAVSARVAANAGAGKTHVLAQRVIRLLLDGIAPEKILCITFTKAAAANMAKRVFDTLGKWTAFDDAGLDREIRRISKIAPDAEVRARARRLFATALETPGGLKVQTIHAFCARLLHQFPFEANVAARFEVLDEAAEAQLLGDIGLGVLLDAARAPEERLGRALATAIAEAADQTFKDVVGEAIRKRDLVRAWIDDGGIEAAIARLGRTLGIDPDAGLDEVEKEIVEGPLLPSCEWAAVAEACRTGSSRDQEQCARLAAAAAGAGASRVEAYLQVFFDGKLSPRASLVTQALAPAHPALAEKLDRDRALPGSQGPARAARLRRSHRQDAAPPGRGARGLGALQARPGHRPRADRRGAGYEPQAMGDHPPAHGRVLRGRRRPSGPANDLRGRRREAVDLLVSRRGAARVRGDAPIVRRDVPVDRAGFSPCAIPPLVPLRPERARRGRSGVRAAGGLCRPLGRRGRNRP